MNKALVGGLGFGLGTIHHPAIQEAWIPAVDGVGKKRQLQIKIYKVRVTNSSKK